MDWGQWTQTVNGQTVDVEPGYGAQCYGLMKNYMNNVIGAPGEISTQYGPHPGFAINVFDGYGQNGLSQYFEKLGPDAQPQQGDVAFWEWGSQIAPESHVAVVNNDLGGSLNVWSQNSPQGYTTLQALPKAGLAGYLRPLNGVSGTSDATAQPAGAFGDSGGGGILPGPGSLGTPDWWNSLFGGLFGQGLKDIVNPQLQQLYVRLFMPSTYIRIMSGFLAIFFVVLCITLIVLDYRKNKNAED